MQAPRTQFTTLDYINGAEVQAPADTVWAFKRNQYRLTIKVEGPANDAGHQFLNGIANLIHKMEAAGMSFADAEAAVQAFERIESHLTIWRRENRLVPESQLIALQGQLDAAIEAKRSMQLDNDKYNQGE